MKKLVQTIEVDAEGLEALLGEWVQIWCFNYIYAGQLIGVNTTDILLGNAYVVYETGGLKSAQFKDAQPVFASDGALRIRTAAIESYCLAPALVK